MLSFSNHIMFFVVSNITLLLLDIHISLLRFKFTNQFMRFPIHNLTNLRTIEYIGTGTFKLRKMFCANFAVNLYLHNFINFDLSIL